VKSSKVPNCSSSSGSGGGGSEGGGGDSSSSSSSRLYTPVLCLAIPKRHQLCLSCTSTCPVPLSVMVWRKPCFHSFLDHPLLRLPGGYLSFSIRTAYPNHFNLFLSTLCRGCVDSTI
jgi:hypothetical protein